MAHVKPTATAHQNMDVLLAYPAIPTIQNIKTVFNVPLPQVQSMWVVHNVVIRLWLLLLYVLLALPCLILICWVVSVCG